MRPQPQQPRLEVNLVDLSPHPQAQSIEVRPQGLETYDALAHQSEEDLP
jgi:hypothetical protein